MKSSVSLEWNATAKVLHWLVAALVIGELLYGLRNYSLDMYDPSDGGWYARTIALHKSFGLLLFSIVVVRVAWRTSTGRPPHLSSMPPWQRRAAQISHALMYAALLLQPILGYLQSAAFGTKTVFFNLFELPNLVPVEWQRPYSRVLWRVTQDAHSVVGLCLGLLVFLHVAAALRHHFVEQDDVLRRMLPRGTS